MKENLLKYLKNILHFKLFPLPKYSKIKRIKIQKQLM